MSKFDYGSFSVWQGGEKVASGWGPYESCKQQAQHYAALYAQDTDRGPVKVRVRRSPRKVSTTQQKESAA
ncbi:hypothetical protein UFOVP730_48 [uncultured Caudovirales phage]|uniref:Uncharacterized protein n=1 Tax=uncultured Caudovirales phage TaxID=2100421 RepID=A0A6J5NQY3_9CAUD|nr:hypothetical protein UFOVP730_48 [uncultured Caudovirales phage]